MKEVSAYSTELLKSNTRKLRYLFESTGEKPIIKAIEYTYIRKIAGRTVYNLGFGDFDRENGVVLDQVNSNNGDMYRVFSTVLNTVPRFFKENEEAAIWVQGSDSTLEFETICLPNCKKRCKNGCKNFNRRIRAYQYFVDKNFVELSKEYLFFGLSNGENQDFVQYIPRNEYIGILIFKKK